MRTVLKVWNIYTKWKGNWKICWIKYKKRGVRETKKVHYDRKKILLYEIEETIFFAMKAYEKNRKKWRNLPNLLNFL